MIVPAIKLPLHETKKPVVGEEFETDSGMGGSFTVRYKGSDPVSGAALFRVVYPTPPPEGWDGMTMRFPASALHAHLYVLVTEEIHLDDGRSFLRGLVKAGYPKGHPAYDRVLRLCPTTARDLASMTEYVLLEGRLGRKALKEFNAAGRRVIPSCCAQRKKETVERMLALAEGFRTRYTDRFERIRTVWLEVSPFLVTAARTTKDTQENAARADM